MYFERDPLFRTRYFEREREREMEEGGTTEEEQLEAPLQFMLLDALFKDAPPSAPCTPPTVTLFGKTAFGCSISCSINDFVPYFWFPAPVVVEGDKENSIAEENLQLILDHFNQFIVSTRHKLGTYLESPIAALSILCRAPLMYYRPSGPSQFLQVKVWRSTDLLTVSKELKSFAEKNDLKSHGLIWKDKTSYEEDIKLGMRFFCDTAIAGGAWIEIRKGSFISCNEQKKTRCEMEVQASWRDVVGLTPDATHRMEFLQLDACKQMSQIWQCKSDITPQDREGGLCTQVQENNLSNLENSHIEGDRGGYPTPENSIEDLRWLAISPLRILALHVQCAGHIQVSKGEAFSRKRPHGHEKVAGRNHGTGNNCSHTNPEHDEKDKADPVDLCCISGGGSAIPSRDPVLIISNILWAPNVSHRRDSKVCFSYSKHEMSGSPPDVQIRIYDSEREMLIAWQDFIRNEIDPDVICMFQCKDSLRYLVERFKALKLGPLDIGRHKGHVTEVKSVVSYGKHWVKQQARMTATSNQEVFRANIDGRIVIDMLRVILVAHNLTTFTLAECSQVFLGTPKEVLSPLSIYRLWNGKYGGIYRLVSYSLREAEVAAELMGKLQALTETIEMARVTGLSTGDVLYKAQMIRVQ